MILEEFDFNLVKNTKLKTLQDTINHSINIVLVDDLADYMDNFIRKVVYPGLILEDTITIKKNYEESSIHINLENMPEELYITIPNYNQITICSGVHGCCDVTPIVFSLINNSKYEVLQISRIDDNSTGGWVTHGVFCCGLYLDYEGYNSYVNPENTKYVVIDQEFINKFKKIKFINLLKTSSGNYDKVLLNKGWVFENENIYNIFWDTLHASGFTNFAKYDVHLKFNLHQMEIARYKDYKHKNSPIGSYFVKGMKKPKIS